MTNEHQRIKISEACGWTRIEGDKSKHTRDRWIEPNDNRTYAKDYAVLAKNLPDYLNDLNAMHEAEKVLTEDQCERYEAFLHDPTVYPGDNAKPSADYIFHASASQRAEAFLRTLNLWTE